MVFHVFPQDNVSNQTDLTQVGHSVYPVTNAIDLNLKSWDNPTACRFVQASNICTSMTGEPELKIQLQKREQYISLGEQDIHSYVGDNALQK